MFAPQIRTKFLVALGGQVALVLYLQKANPNDYKSNSFFTAT
ncbi:hypothetical protein LEP1GSC202_2919 [Leptospira yanagawae serovar Saopaulo str. Sao Paulo = ATCC 700523]|uniref:Uncharacterized protein n=1 Tax=Leptospira yanagawae serovar Saopaulo str. Sao Paulo = ATCC 700523 TaxID=1249483 RepID=A0A5E8H9Y2_9LEPT|nr:hypothetical protein LEP1GSC202_2919 [Leptospira yanagawae serovar Saopaulo str. Sao Paulo = ATCC 700523]